MSTIRWGILGCGDVTEVKSGPGFQKAKGSELVAVMRRDGAKAKDYAKRHGVARWYDNADALIRDAAVDAVYVATPPGTHEFYAMKVLAAGKPCYVEKPVSRNASEARRMVDGFKQAGVPLFVAYYRRALPRFLKVKEILESGVLGRVKAATWFYKDSRGVEKHASAPWRVLAEHSGGGLFLDMGSHALDLLDFWLGPLTVTGSSARNEGKNFPVEDSVEVFFEWGKETKGGLSCQFNGGEDDLFTLVGANGWVSVPCFASGQVTLKVSGTEEQIFDLPNPPHVAQPLIQTVVDELLGVGKCASTGESGLRTQVVMDAALDDYYGGREDRFWEREWPGAKGNDER